MSNIPYNRTQAEQDFFDSFNWEKRDRGERKRIRKEQLRNARFL